MTWLIRFACLAYHGNKATTRWRWLEVRQSSIVTNPRQGSDNQLSKELEVVPGCTPTTSSVTLVRSSNKKFRIKIVDQQQLVLPRFFEMAVQVKSQPGL